MMHNTNLNNVLLAWALGTTLLATGAIGYILGKQTGRPEPVHAAPVTAGATAESEASGRPAAEQFVVPETFRGAARHWRSEVSDELSGYTVLFEPERRRFIAERCEHHGYLSVEQANSMTSLCETLLKGTLASLEQTQARLRDRNGRSVDVALELDETSETPVLRLAFAGHDIALIPGSRNDLIQAFETLPVVQKNKRTYLMAMMNPRENATTRDTDR